jgi:hypothetical protein
LKISSKIPTLRGELQAMALEIRLEKGRFPAIRHRSPAPEK